MFCSLTEDHVSQNINPAYGIENPILLFQEPLIIELDTGSASQAFRNSRYNSIILSVGYSVPLHQIP